MSKWLQLTKGLIGADTLSCANVDDVLNVAKEYGIDELKLTIGEMRIAVMWYLANSGDKDENKPKVISEGKVDRMLGVNLKLI